MTRGRAARRSREGERTIQTTQMMLDEERVLDALLKAYCSEVHTSSKKLKRETVQRGRRREKREPCVWDERRRDGWVAEK